MDTKEQLIQLSDRLRMIDIRISHIENGHVKAHPGELDSLRAEYARIKAECGALPEISELVDEDGYQNATRH